MAEYIEREAVIDKLDEWKELYQDSGGACDVLVLAKRAVRKLPAADVRHVVLCRECVHWEKYNNTAGCGYCHKVKFEYGADGYVFNPVREPDFYCANGEKREES